MALQCVHLTAHMPPLPPCRQLCQLKEILYINPESQMEERITRLRQAQYKWEYRQRHLRLQVSRVGQYSIYTGYKYGGFAPSYAVYTGYLYGFGQVRHLELIVPGVAIEAHHEEWLQLLEAVS